MIVIEEHTPNNLFKERKASQRDEQLLKDLHSQIEQKHVGVLGNKGSRHRRTYKRQRNTEFIRPQQDIWNTDQYQSMQNKFKESYFAPVVPDKML